MNRRQRQQADPHNHTSSDNDSPRAGADLSRSTGCAGSRTFGPHASGFQPTRRGPIRDISLGSWVVLIKPSGPRRDRRAKPSMNVGRRSVHRDPRGSYRQKHRPDRRCSARAKHHPGAPRLRRPATGFSPAASVCAGNPARTGAKTRARCRTPSYERAPKPMLWRRLAAQGMRQSAAIQPQGRAPASPGRADHGAPFGRTRAMRRLLQPAMIRSKGPSCPRRLAR